MMASKPLGCENTFSIDSLICVSTEKVTLGLIKQEFQRRIRKEKEEKKGLQMKYNNY